MIIAARLLEKPESAGTKKDKGILIFLKNGKFIIEDSIDELAIVTNRKMCGIKDKNKVDVILMPNMDCNFTCQYCYENHKPSNKMSKNTEDSVKLWLGKEIDNHKIVFMGWFGGEPILSYKTILSLGKFARNRCREKGVSLISHITTNGFALTRSLIEELVDIEIFSYQITVDGPPEIHNKTRVLKNSKNSKGSFDQIFKNILMLAKTNDEVKISLRVNYNHNNLHTIPELLHMFPENVRSQLMILYEPIFGDTELSATENMSGDEISSAITDYYNLASSMGYDVMYSGLGVGRLAYCHAEREDQYVVNYNGDVFKCYVTDFLSTNRVGYINKAGVFIKEESKWDAWINLDLFEKKCEACIFLPLCMGGCRSDRLKNKGTGSYCSLVPTNTLFALKAASFDSFNKLFGRKVVNSQTCL